MSDTEDIYPWYEYNDKENNMAQHYTVTSVEDTKFEPSANGSRFYNVGFEGVQGKLLWSTKSRPETGSRVYGHIEPSKSGKSMLFKRDKEEGQAAYSPTPRSPQAGKKSDDERSDDIRWGLCVKEAAGYITKWQENLDADQWAIQVNEYANALYKVSHGPAPEQKVVPDDYMGGPPVLDDEIDLGELPF